MGMEIKMLGRVRTLWRDMNFAQNSEDTQLHVTHRGDQFQVPGIPGDLVYTVIQGGSFQVAHQTGVAALTALPTTTAALTLYNGEPDGGKCYIIESFGTWEAVTDATQNNTSVLFACMNVGKTTVVTDTLASSVRSPIGNKYGGLAKIASGATIVNDGWFAHSKIPVVPTVFAGTLWVANEVQPQTKGWYIVPPGRQFNVQIVKSVAAAAAQQFHFIRWHEMILPIASS